MATSLYLRSGSETTWSKHNVHHLPSPPFVWTPLPSRRYPRTRSQLSVAFACAVVPVSRFPPVTRDLSFSKIAPISPRARPTQRRLVALQKTTRSLTNLSRSYRNKSFFFLSDTACLQPALQESSFMIETRPGLRPSRVARRTSARGSRACCVSCAARYGTACKSSLERIKPRALGTRRKTRPCPTPSATIVEVR